MEQKYASLALHLLTPEAAVLEDLGTMIERRPLPWEDRAADAPWYAVPTAPVPTSLLPC